MNEEIPQNAVSIYGQSGDAMDDFPVLKAFQQYIDAEQTKARKRMTIMGIFFGFMIVAVVAVFVLLLVKSGERNQQLNDKLIEYAMRDRDREIAAKTAELEQKTSEAIRDARQDAAMKAVSDTLADLQKQLQERDAKIAEIAAVKVESRPSAELLERERIAREDEEKVKRATALLSQEKERLQAEKERLRQQEIELHRRRLYPEEYDESYEYGKAPEPAPRQQRATRRSKPAATSEKPEKPAAQTEEFQTLDNLQPNDYFDVDDWLIPAN